MSITPDQLFEDMCLLFMSVEVMLERSGSVGWEDSVNPLNPLVSTMKTYESETELSIGFVEFEFLFFKHKVTEFSGKNSLQ